MSLVLYNDEGHIVIQFGGSKSPISISGYDPSKLNNFKKLVVKAFNAFEVMWVRDILGYEEDLAIVLSLALFEVSDSSEKNEAELKKKLSEVKEPQDLKDAMVASANEQMSALEKDLHDLRVSKTLVEDELDAAHGEVSDLKNQLAKKDKEKAEISEKLESAMIDCLLAGDQGFEKAEQHALFTLPQS
ncbi:hypothetical protein RYX36_037300 [Vicia faba]